MGFFDFLFRGAKNRPPGDYVIAEDMQLAEICADYAARNYAVEICAAIIARAIAKCDFRTYINGKPDQGEEWYLWNVRPNPDQSSTEFWQKFVRKMLVDGEAIAVPAKRNGRECFFVADSYSVEERPDGSLRFVGVTRGNFQYTKEFRSEDIIRCRFNPANIKAITDSTYAVHGEMLKAASKSFQRSNSIRMKLHINQQQRAAADFVKRMDELNRKSIKPFVEKDDGILQEYDGYDFSKFDAGTGTTTGTGGPQSYRDLFNMVLDSYAKAFGIPPVLIHGDVAGTQDAMQRFLTLCIDPIAYMIQEELNGKRCGFETMRSGSFIQIDTTTIQHIDMFSNADKIEKLVGSGVYSINDILTAAGGVKINEPWAEKHYLTLNISNIETAAKAVEEVNDQ